MNLQELITKIHQEESKCWDKLNINLPKSENERLQQLINKILQCENIEEFSEWLLAFCGGEGLTIINYLLTYLLDEEIK